MTKVLVYLATRAATLSDIVQVIELVVARHTRCATNVTVISIVAAVAAYAGLPTLSAVKPVVLCYAAVVAVIQTSCAALGALGAEQPSVDKVGECGLPARQRKEEKHCGWQLAQAARGGAPQLNHGHASRSCNLCASC